MRVEKSTYRMGVVIVCACALAMTSCNTDKEPIDSGLSVISFNSAAVAAGSRAIISDDTSLQAACSSGEGIGVWGVVNDEENTNSLLLDNTKLYYDSEWTYAPLRYWNRGALHEFWAIYPYSASGCSLDVATGLVTRSDITLGTTPATNNVDYMCAFDSRDLSAPDATTAPVPLEMTHALSLLEFEFINAMGEISGVTDISLEGLRYKGDIVFGRDGALGGAADGEVDIRVDVAADKVAAGAGVYVGSCSTSPIPKNLSTIYNLFEGNDGVVVMPQSLLGATVAFNMTIGTTPTTLNLSQFTPSEWEAGKKYVYTFTLTSTTIVCDVRVVDWIKDDVTLVPID